MKKSLAFLLAMVCAIGLWAANPAPAKAPVKAPAKAQATAQKTTAQTVQKEENWTGFQLGFLPGAPSDMLTDPVYGIKLGAPICLGAPVWGLEASVLYSGSESVSGVQCSVIFSQANTVTGLQFSPVNFVKSCFGLQLGIYNSAQDKTFQIGLLNHIENGPLPWMIVMNFNL